jgi:site-specific DNA-methyltransferase (adenine-specific)
MGKAWDKDKGGRDKWIAWLAEILSEARRVLKPGACGWVWALPRTSHWTGMACEDAGFEVRDVMTHVQGQGFPKSKALLKPAAENWILVRKPGPLRELRIDECRVGMSEEDAESIKKNCRPNSAGNVHIGTTMNRPAAPTVNVHPAGRFPANFCLSHTPECQRRGEKRVKGAGWRNHDTAPSVGAVYGDDKRDRTGPHYAAPDGLETVEDWACADGCPVRALGEQSGVTRCSKRSVELDIGRTHRSCYGKPSESGQYTASNTHSDTGTAARFFHCFPADVDPFVYVAKAHRSDRGDGNKHPTVKPVALMRHLIRLVAQPGGLVIDPFAGSGTTGVACMKEGLIFAGCDIEEEYIHIATQRLTEASK